MVSWTADGKLSGYDPATQEYKAQLFNFVQTTPGSVDINAPTRLRYQVSSEGLPAGTTRPNGVAVQAPLTVTSGDVANNGWGVPSGSTPGGPGTRGIMVGVHVTPASAFPAGSTPTPAQIRGSASRVYFAPIPGLYWTPGNYVWNYSIPASALQPGAKYWVALIPTSVWYIGHSGIQYAYSAIKDTPTTEYDVNVIGKALSIWTDRSGTAPVITSPSPGTFSPGDTFALTIAPSDPDAALAPDDALRRNRDLAGVEFQYAAQPTPDNPNPVWLPLEFTTDTGAMDMRSYAFAEDYRNAGLYQEHDGLRTAFGGTVIVGTDPHDIDLAGHARRAGLPSGDWQIRARTFDWGHPYPKRYRPMALANPTLGADRQIPSALEPVASPWSASVKVSVPAQVLPPIAIYPKGNIAVAFDGTDIPIAWNYRNTHIPPYEQAIRVVQIRKVEDSDDEEAWKTLVFDFSDEHGTVIPVSQAASPGGTTNHTTDPGFEAGTVGGWTAGWVLAAPTVPATVTNVTSAPNSHSGTHHMRLYTPSTDGISAASRIYELDPRDLWISFESWIAPHDTTDHLEVSITWRDEDNNLLDYDPYYDASYVANKTTGASWGGWKHAVMLSEEFVGDPRIPRNPGAKYAEITILAYGNSVVGTQDMRIDDQAFTTEYLGVDAFTLENSTHYEWHVQTQDTDGEYSNFSTAARFWTVPAPSSGDSRPNPASSVEGATLGCGTHTVEIYRRGGVERVGVLSNISKLDWERKRDDISTAEVVISDWGIDCGNLLAALQSWAYELVIWRDNGFSRDRVWEGPITLLTYEVDKVTIDAKDIAGYLYRRIIKQDMDDASNASPTKGMTVVNRAQRVVQNAFAPDDPNVLEWLRVIVRDDDAKQYRSTPAYSRTAFEEVDDMAANAGLDYTVLGRSILLWGTKHRIGTLPEFKDEHLGNAPIVSEYGMSMANRYAVSNGNGVYGEATRGLDPVSGNDPIYGLVEMLSSTWASDSEEDSGTYTQEGIQKMQQSFSEMADRSINDRYGPPVVVRIPDNTSLNANAPISIQDLVPGVVIPLRSTKTLRTVVGSQKLDSIKVVEESGNETITITMSAFSRDDASMEGGEGE